MITNPDFFLTESQKKLKAKLVQQEVRFPALLETVTKSNPNRGKRNSRGNEAVRLAAMQAWEKQFEQRWGVKLNNIAKATPTLTGGELKSWAPGVSERYSIMVLKNGKIVEQLFRRGINGSAAFIDQLTFLISKQSCANLFSEYKLQDDVDYIQNLNIYLYEIFGFACSHDRDKSANFYSSSYNLGDFENSYGLVCIGGGISASNADTICVEITATGLSAAKDGWEQRLYDFSELPQVESFYYTRVDTARDYLDGSFSLESVLDWYFNGGFTCSVQRPKLRREGDDWDNDTKNGRTVYIGSRMSSKLFRAYEKGKQLGMKESPWVRFEIEWRNRDLIIPKDIILHAGDYMSAAYPCLADLFQTDTPKRTVVKERIVQRGVEHVIKYARMQCSKAVNMLKDLGKTDAEILSIFDPKVDLPKCVNPGQYFAEFLNIDFITHKLKCEFEVFQPS